MMYFYYFIVSLFVCVNAVFVVSCSTYSKGTQLEQQAHSFANALYSWQLDSAIKLCTPSSKKAISFLATNLSDEDIELIRSQSEFPHIELSIPNVSETDTLVVIYIKVKDALLMKELGSDLQQTPEAYFSLTMHYTSEGWKADALSLKQYATKPQML